MKAKEQIVLSQQQGDERVRCSVIYLGYVDVGCTAESIAARITSKKVDVLSCYAALIRHLHTNVLRCDTFLD